MQDNGAVSHRRPRALRVLVAVPLAVLIAGRFLLAGAIGGLIAWGLGVSVSGGVLAGLVVGWLVQAVGLRWFRRRRTDRSIATEAR